MGNARRNTRLAIIAAIGIIAVFGCGGSSGGGGGGKQMVTITGDLSIGTHAKVDWQEKCINWIIPEIYALDDSLVTKVVVFYGDGEWATADVTGGAFSINVEVGKPVGLVFAGISNNFLGYLTLGSGIDSLPLTSLADGTTTIDLQTLSSTSTVVDASYDPLGTELTFSAEELAAMAQCDDLFSCTVQNPDADGNGIVDVLEGKFFNIYVQYFVDGGSFGAGLTPTVTTPAAITGYRLSFKAHDPARPASVNFTGPGGSGLSGEAADFVLPSTAMTTYQAINVTAPPIPPAGQYTIAYNAGTVTFDLADQSGAPANIIVAVPTITLNGDNTINKINWEYKLGDGSGTALDPSAVISEIALQIDGTGTPYQSYPQPNRMYSSDMLPVETVEHTPPYQAMDWADITIIYMAYNDVYANHYVVSFVK